MTCSLSLFGMLMLVRGEGIGLLLLHRFERLRLGLGWAVSLSSAHGFRGSTLFEGLLS